MSHHKLGDRSMHDVHQVTQERANFLRQAGHSVIIMLECEWAKLNEEDKTVRSLVNSLQLVSHLEPRDTFFGGPTNAINLHYAVSEDEKSITSNLHFFPVG